MKRFILIIFRYPIHFILLLKFWLIFLVFKAQKKKTLIYNLHHDYFFDLFKDIYLELESAGIIVYFSYRYQNPALRKYLGLLLPKQKLIPSTISPFIPAQMFVTAEVTGPDFPFKFLKTKNLQMYHGIGTANLYAQKDVLTRFDIHFAVGPQHRKLLKYLAHYSNKKLSIYEIGYPKTDRIFQPTELSLKQKYNPQAHKVILYVPHWNEFASLHKFEEKLICLLAKSNAQVLIKPHNYLFAKFPEKDWKRRLTEIVSKNSNIMLAEEADTQLFYQMADIVIADIGSTSGFEYCLLKKNLIMYENQEWFSGRKNTEIEKELLKTAFTFSDLIELEKLINLSLAPDKKFQIDLKTQQQLQSELISNYLYNPGQATEKAVAAILTELNLPAAKLSKQSQAGN